MASTAFANHGILYMRYYLHTGDMDLFSGAELNGNGVQGVNTSHDSFFHWELRFRSSVLSARTWA